MNILKNAKCVQVVKDMDKGRSIIPCHNNRFNNYGSVATDCLLAQQEEADRRLEQIKLQRNKA